MGSCASILALADGSVFHGIAIGSPGETVGEVVFNTAMTGYQEVLTDPSYARQMVTFTASHIGNVGVNAMDAESSQVWAAGLIVRDFSPIASNWRSEQRLAAYLEAQKVVGIRGIDTRRLTRILREKGAMNGCISSVDLNPDSLIAKAKAAPSLAGLDLARVVSLKNQFSLKPDPTAHRHHVVVYDFGVKQNSLNLLLHRGCRLTLVHATTPAAEVLALKPDGVLLSNGPGDPAACDYAIVAAKELMHANIPLFGICLGFQILGLACGAKTQKMKFGHHGANHPVVDLRKQKVLITSQNHGFMVDAATLPPEVEVTHRSLFDQSLQGFRHRSKPVIAFQGHPEGSPGPHDIEYLFDEFIQEFPPS